MTVSQSAGWVQCDGKSLLVHTQGVTRDGETAEGALHAFVTPRAMIIARWAYLCPGDLVNCRGFKLQFSASMSDKVEI
jgi:hypothetical protein